MLLDRIIRSFPARPTRGALVVAVGAILALTVVAPPAHASTSLKGTDFNGDGFSDIVGINFTNSCLYEWYSNGRGGFDSAVQVGCDWGNYSLTSPGDLNHDGYADLVGINRSNDCLYEWLSAGGAGFNTAQLAGLGCSFNALIDVASAGDVNGDGNADLLVFDMGTDCFQIQFGSGRGTFSGGPTTCTAPFARAAQGAGDINSDGSADLLAIDNSTGYLYMWSGNGNGTFSGPIKIGSGWGGYFMFSLGDLNGDGRGDLLAIDSFGDLYRWYGTGLASFGTAAKIGTGWNEIEPGL